MKIIPILEIEHKKIVFIRFSLKNLNIFIIKVDVNETNIKSITSDISLLFIIRIICKQFDFNKTVAFTTRRTLVDRLVQLGSIS